MCELQWLIPSTISGLILGLFSANKRRRCKITSPLMFDSILSNFFKKSICGTWTIYIDGWAQGLGSSDELAIHFPQPHATPSKWCKNTSRNRKTKPKKYIIDKNICCLFVIIYRIQNSQTNPLSTPMLSEGRFQKAYVMLFIMRDDTSEWYVADKFRTLEPQAGITNNMSACCYVILWDCRTM